MLSLMPRFPSKISLRSISIFSGVMAASKVDQVPLPVRPYKPQSPDDAFPYSAGDLTPTENGRDASFYQVPRFVTHIDDNAIINLRKYYDDVLPRKGSILDFCSSWVSHFPPEVEEAQKTGSLRIFGTGMNESELNRNPILNKWTVQNLNEDPELKLPNELGESKLDASTCVVSIDYLTKPVEVLQSIRRQTNEGGKIHLAISNRCFPTKVVGRWLQVGEDERLEMVGDYLWWSGWRDVEIVSVVKATWMKDPLWVVRATNKDADGPKLS